MNPPSFQHLALLSARLRQLATEQQWDACVPITHELQDMLSSGKLPAPTPADEEVMSTVAADFQDMLERAQAAHGDIGRLLAGFDRTAKNAEHKN